MLSLAVCGTAAAQSNPRQLADANKSAMEAYNNLDIDASKASLDKAIKNAEKNGIRGPGLARSYSNLAVVLVGGLGDQKGAISAFQKALSEDPTVEPDPIVATPEVMQAFNAAKKSAPAAAVTEEDVPAPRKRSSTPAEGNLQHTPVAEQLTQTAVPVFVAKDDSLDIDRIKIAYRSTGMSKPRSANMIETEDGYTFLIPCTDVFEPEVEYFIVAIDGEGKEVGRFGAADAPAAVPIVGTRTRDAPSLPGEAPPSQCSTSDNECPPGMPGCDHGNAGLGEACSANSDCGSGMVCDDDYCAMGESEEEEESSSSKGRGGKKKFYLDLGIGVAMTAVGKGRAADRNITKPLLNDVAARSRNGDNSLDLAAASTNLNALGWDCKSGIAEGADGAQSLTVQNCAVAVNPGGIVAVPVINFAAGYFLTPSFALALTGRFQIGRGEGPLAGITVGGRGEYYLTKPSDKGLKLGLLGGVSLGQIQARPPADGTRQGPYATNANVGGIGLIVNAGARVAYMFTPGIGLNLTPVMNFGLPNFLFALDLTAGVTAAF
ncbi:MAG TPA: tetratricopeptide repeat protein [Polyangiales bacterium]|nr:tetratricopeptide repeat protein [Polyangiales bacterium]